MGKRASVSKKGKTSTAVAAGEADTFKGWVAVAEFLRAEPRGDVSNALQLIHVLSCSRLEVGFQAEINWYTGGNNYVTLPYAVVEKTPGVYFARAKHIRWLDKPDEDEGPETPSASISHLRWLGTRHQFLKAVKEKGRDFGKKKFALLMEMLTVNVGSSSSGDES